MIEAGRLAPERSETTRRDWQIAADPRFAVAGLLALGFWLLSPVLPTSMMANVNDDRSAASASNADGTSVRAGRREYTFGGYGGASYTQPSTVYVDNPGATDMTASDFGWIGRPFKSPIYYGLRTQRWNADTITGTMIDFTHAKAIAVVEDTAKFTGTYDGKPVPPSAKLETIFNRLEFSHGHNMLTLNGLVRSPASWLPVRPYFGLGGGISLPHTEIDMEGRTRTFEYQFAGFVGQALAGIEIPLGRTSVFMEYKFTYAPYSVPLSETRQGDLLVTDLWRQFRAWMSGEKPPGGRLSTTLATHHAIGGVLIRSSSAPATP